MGVYPGGISLGVLEAPGGGPYPRVPWGPCADPLSGAHFGASRDPRFRGPGGAPGPPRKKCTFRRVFNNSPIRDRMGQNGNPRISGILAPILAPWAQLGWHGVYPISSHNCIIKWPKAGQQSGPRRFWGSPWEARPGPAPGRARSPGPRARGRAGAPRGAPARPRARGPGERARPGAGPGRASQGDPQNRRGPDCWPAFGHFIIQLWLEMG